MSNEHEMILRDNLSQLKSITPSHIDTNRICRLAITCLSRTPALRQCTASSFFLAVATCVEMGLEPGVLGHVAIIPFGKVAQVIPMYQGLIELARRTGDLRQIYAVLVREGDDFKVSYGLNPDIHHKPKGDSGRPWTHVYAVGVLSDGSKQFEVMDKAQVMKIKDKAASKKGPWKDYEEAMVKKTVLKQLLKMLPKATTLAVALTHDDHAEVGKAQIPDGLDISALKNVIMPEPEPERPPITQPTRQSDAAPVVEQPPEPGQVTAEPPPEVTAPPQEDQPPVGHIPAHEMKRDDVAIEIAEMEASAPLGPLRRVRDELGFEDNYQMSDLDDEQLQQLLHMYRTAIV